MPRLWDKGGALDQRVLEYTAGEDHALDDRLVRYDVTASIAHAEMLHAAGLLAADDLRVICDGLRELGIQPRPLQPNLADVLGGAGLPGIRDSYRQQARR